MFAFLIKLLLVARTRLKSRANLEAENIVLRQQVIVLSRKAPSRVRLRNIDAAELHARCSRELRLALAARAALQRLLADGSVTLSHVGPDKYPGRIDANVATNSTADISAAMLSGGFARRYDGGRRGSWCRS